MATWSGTLKISDRNDFIIEEIDDIRGLPYIHNISYSLGYYIDKEIKIHSGDYIAISPAHVMTHDNTGAVIPKFNSIGATKIANPRQVVHTFRWILRIRENG